MGLIALSEVAAAVLAGALSAIATVVLLNCAKRLPHSEPNARSLHERPIPRVGGVAIWVGFLPVALLAPPPVPDAPLWLSAWFAVAMISLIDDWQGVRAAIRLAVHTLAAGMVAVAILRPDVAAGSAAMPFLGAAAVALLIVWSANLFNFMDGSDGLAAAMAVCGFGAYGVAAVLAAVPAQAYFALAAATLPFLAVNLPPARTFMGDVGAVPLGFLAATFGVAGCVAGVWPGWFPLLVFLPFVADATVTLVRRLVSGERVWEAHNSHYYQRLHRLGPGHRGTLWWYGALMLGAGASALVTLAAAPLWGWVVVASWTVALAAFFAGIDYHWNRRNPAP